MKNIFFLLICTSFIFACNTSKTISTNGDGKHFGEKINKKGAISFDELVRQMDGKESIETKFKGTTESVCQAKGCWVNIQSESGKTMFVKFKDYAFFMPKDLAGQEVIMEGKAFYEVTSVEELRHYAEDAGKSKEEIEAITEGKKELKFLASGVLIP